MAWVAPRALCCLGRTLGGVFSCVAFVGQHWAGPWCTRWSTALIALYCFLGVPPFPDDHCCAMAVVDWTSKEHFLETTAELLRIEREEERQEQAEAFQRASLDVLEKRGVCLRKLEVC